MAGISSAMTDKMTAAVGMRGVNMKPFHAAVIAASFVISYLAVPQAHAQDAKTMPGEYCLAGVREVGSCMRL